MRNNRDKMRWQGGKATGWVVRASGFTLAELLISIGILGVGLTMSAALFPAGLDANKDSANDLLGTMICQNGLAIAKAKVKTFHVPGTSFTFLSDPGAGVFTPAELQYPYGSGEETGFYVFGRRIEADKNEYELLIIAYQKHPNGGEVALQPAKGNAFNKGGTGKFDFSAGKDYAQVGAMMIITMSPSGYNGAARIVSMEGSTADLDRPLTPKTDRRVEVKILYQEGVPTSPILGVMSSRTSLPTQ